MGFRITVQGDFALFTRPEMKVERVSYDVPTPSAMVGLISSIYWHPGVKYIIDKIYVYNPIETMNVRRNEISAKLSPSKVAQQMRETAADISIYAKDNISQRGSLILKNVSYGISFHFELTKEKDDDMTEEKCYNILLRRLRKGQCFSQPCLGCREFAAKVALVETLPPSELTGDVDLGYMLYDLVYKKGKNGNPLNDADPRFYRPRMKNGVIDVAEYAKEVVC